MKRQKPNKLYKLCYKTKQQIIFYILFFDYFFSLLYINNKINTASYYIFQHFNQIYHI